MSVSLNKLERCCFSNDVLKLVKEPHAVLVNPKWVLAAHTRSQEKKSFLFHQGAPCEVSCAGFLNLLLYFSEH